MGRLLAWLTSAWLWSGGFGATAAPSISAALDRQLVQVGETVTLTLTCQDFSPPGAPSLPVIPNVTVAGLTASQSINIINGQRTIRQSYHYTLLANKEGDVAIPPIQAQASGVMLSTQPLRLRIGPAAGPGGVDPTIARMAFLQLNVTKQQIYLGEALPIEVVLYVTEGREAHLPQLPGEGFTVGKMVQGGQSRTVRQGQQYTVVPFRTYVAAARPGQLELGPATMSIAIPKPNARRSIFGDIMDWRQVTLSTERVKITVLPLPADNVPAEFQGVVGSYSLSVTASPTAVGVGDPITVRVQISGRGLMESLTLPPQSRWNDFKAYPATGQLESNDPHGLTGVKKFEQVIIPQNHEIKSLPPFWFSFFDPEKKAYRTLSNAPIPLVVRATASAVVPALGTNSAGQTSPAADDIIHIKPRLEGGGFMTPVLLRQPWFLALQAVPALTWLVLLTARKRKEMLSRNPRLQRQRQVAQRMREGLSELREHAVGKNSDAFFATLFRLLQEQLGERLELPASAITEAVIEERLRGGDLSRETLHALQGLFQGCNQARYAPVKSTEELNTYVPKLERVVEELQRWKGAP